MRHIGNEFLAQGFHLFQFQRHLIHAVRQYIHDLVIPGRIFQAGC